MVWKLHPACRWLDQGLVVVTLNYRAGALGFLSLGTAEVPGNQGLRDQVHHGRDKTSKLILAWR